MKFSSSLKLCFPENIYSINLENTNIWSMASQKSMLTWFLQHLLELFELLFFFIFFLRFLFQEIIWCFDIIEDHSVRIIKNMFLGPPPWWVLIYKLDNSPTLNLIISLNLTFSPSFFLFWASPSITTLFSLPFFSLIAYVGVPTTILLNPIKL